MLVCPAEVPLDGIAPILLHLSLLPAQMDPIMLPDRVCVCVGFCVFSIFTIFPFGIFWIRLTDPDDGAVKLL